MRIPVIASLNGVSAEAWSRFARNIAQAGADALELNIYEVALDPRESGPAIERRIRDLVIDLKHAVSIPVAVKLGPFFTAFGHMAREIEMAGADGLVIFNRFYQPDIDIATMAPVLHIELSTSAELLLRLRWLSALHGHVRCSLAVTGGVATPADGIKAILAGAHGVQLVSAILRNGPGYFSAMRQGLTDWMESKGFTSIEQVRGQLDRQTGPADLDAREAISEPFRAGPPRCAGLVGRRVEHVLVAWRAPEKVRRQELVQHRIARLLLQPAEPAELRLRQLKPRHFQILSLNQMHRAPAVRSVPYS